MQSSKTVGRFVLNQVWRRNSSHAADCKPTSTYNDLPSPCGNWKTQYDANNARYNAHLAIGIAAFVGAVAFGPISGIWKTNNTIPDAPAVIDNYKD